MRTCEEQRSWREVRQRIVKTWIRACSIMGQCRCGICPEMLRDAYRSPCDRSGNDSKRLMSDFADQLLSFSIRWGIVPPKGKGYRITGVVRYASCVGWPDNEANRRMNARCCRNQNR